MTRTAYSFSATLAGIALSTMVLGQNPYQTPNGKPCKSTQEEDSKVVQALGEQERRGVISVFSACVATERIIPETDILRLSAASGIVKEMWNHLGKIALLSPPVYPELRSPTTESNLPALTQDQNSVHLVREYVTEKNITHQWTHGYLVEGDLPKFFAFPIRTNHDLVFEVMPIQQSGYYTTFNSRAIVSANARQDIIGMAAATQYYRRMLSTVAADHLNGIVRRTPQLSREQALADARQLFDLVTRTLAYRGAATVPSSARLSTQQQNDSMAFDEKNGFPGVTALYNKTQAMTPYNIANTYRRTPEQLQIK